tara:strand:+ start:55 stop:438 length:384 start_codon:yes stop_codon:yes gene_type:complete
MRKNIIASILTLGIAGFAYAAPPQDTKPLVDDKKIHLQYEATIDSLSEQLAVVKKENKSLKAELLAARAVLKKLRGERATRENPSEKAKSLRDKLMEKFDKNDDGVLDAKERPNRVQMQEFYRNLRK